MKRKRPTICDNFDDDYTDSDEDEGTTNVTHLDNKMLIQEIMENTHNDSIFDKNLENDYSWITKDNDSVINVRQSMEKKNHLDSMPSKYAHNRTSHDSTTKHTVNHKNKNDVSIGTDYPSFKTRVSQKHHNSMTHSIANHNYIRK